MSEHESMDYLLRPFSERSPIRKFRLSAADVLLVLFLSLIPSCCNSWTFTNVLRHHSESTTATIGCLQLLSGYVGGGNYTYYRLSHEGDIVLLLDTSLGDADIYASQNFLQPTFELDSHDLQSVTCGLDRIHIAANLRRPVGIGIYGHPSHEVSVYHLCVNLIEVSPMTIASGSSSSSSFDSEELYYDDGADGTPSEHMPNRGGSPRMSYYDKDDHEESVLWSLLISALEVLVEILT